MLDIKLIRTNPQHVKEGIARKGANPDLVDEALRLDAEYRELVRQIQSFREKRNIAAKRQSGEVDQGKQIKAELRQLEPEAEKARLKLHSILHQIPNLPLSQVPEGKGENDNVVVRTWGKPTHFDFAPKDHVELGKSLNILDFDTGAKVTGTQFYFLYNEGALLELALIQYAFKTLVGEGFTPVITPDLAKARYYVGTGYMPKGNEAQTYTIEGQDLGLIATAEVTLAGKHADEVIPEANLPMKYIGYSHVFRQEAGAYGRYSRGLYRVHQFTKAEMFIYCLPEESEKFHEYLLSLEEKIYQGLQIPYRVVEMCTGDLGAMAARKFDIEAWMPGRNDYGEVTSTSNCTDYQARNLNIRFKREDGEVAYVHMLNGTAIATSRTQVAILENFQNADGSVTIPEPLHLYMGKSEIRRG